MKKLKGVKGGCGYFGAVQLEAWSRIEGAQIVALCDLDLERAERTPLRDSLHRLPRRQFEGHAVPLYRLSAIRKRV